MNPAKIFLLMEAKIVNELLKQDFIEEFIISVIPILLGDGKRLFKDGRPEQKLKLISAKSFDKGRRTINRHLNELQNARTDLWQNRFDLFVLQFERNFPSTIFVDHLCQLLLRQRQILKEANIKNKNRCHRNFLK